MGRAPFQVLVFPFRRIESLHEFAVFRRSDSGYWQGISGGGEDGESPLETARRETTEEAGLPESLDFYKLDSLSHVPGDNFAARNQWPPNLYVIPSYPFAVNAASLEIALSYEHTVVKWLSYECASTLLHWESNRIALWELQQRLIANDLGKAL